MSPLLSIVVCGRNDNHNGDFDRRAELALRHNSAHLYAAGIEHEWIWVEWNPLPDRPPFAAHVAAFLPNVRTCIVPPSIHRHCCDNPATGVLQFFAKNVGIRRATGDWILAMNADTYLTEGVVSFLRCGSRNGQTMYLAERVDFDPAHLNDAIPDSPVHTLDDYRTVRVSQIEIPSRFGSAGDFTLMSRAAWLNTTGHYEGVRFSNQHIDTLLCLQHQALGGSFQAIGRVYHADHADSWNNFKTGDDAKHHHGHGYDWKRVALPYANPSNWGLAEFPADGAGVLTPPAGLVLRAEMPASVLIPDALSAVSIATAQMLEAIDRLARGQQRVVVYGPGQQFIQLVEKHALKGLNLTGYIDDGRELPGMPCPRLTWDALHDADFDVLLIGSIFWQAELRTRALAHLPANRIEPIG